MADHPERFYSDASLPYPPGPANAPPSSTWTCTTCHTTTHIFHRASHLFSRLHIRNSKLNATPERPRNHLPSLSLWRCVPCGEEMHLFYRDEHVASKEHARNTILVHDTIDTGDDAAGVARRAASSTIARCTSYYLGIHPAEMKVPVMEHTAQDGYGDGGIALESSAVGGNQLSGEGKENFGPIPPTQQVPEDPAQIEETKCPYCLQTVQGHRCTIMQCAVCGVRMNRRYKVAHLITTRHRKAVELLEEKEIAERQRDNPVGRVDDVPVEVPPESTVPGLSQPTPSQQTNPTSNSPAVSKVWTCTVCFKTMATGSQRSHLEGIKHRNREQKMRQDAAEKHPKSEDHQQVQVEVREESSVDEVEHRRGSKHPRDCRICARVVVALSELSPVASTTSETSDDEPDIDEESFLEAHLSADRQSRAALTLRIPSSAQPRSTQPAVSHISYIQPPLPAGQWHCTLCSRTMPLGSRKHHTEGRQHRARYREAEFLEGTSAPGQRAAITGRGLMLEEDEFYCECGRDILGGTWCTNCDFRADGGWGKKNGKL